MQMFSTLFGRACKNYCLALLATQSLIITGGVAIHHPGMVFSTEFYDEFIKSRHRHILTRINIYLNPGIETGLLGGAYFGMSNVMKK
jgi:glucokinase